MREATWTESLRARSDDVPSAEVSIPRPRLRPSRRGTASRRAIARRAAARCNSSERSRSRVKLQTFETFSSGRHHMLHESGRFAELEQNTARTSSTIRGRATRRRSRTSSIAGPEIPDSSVLLMLGRPTVHRIPTRMDCFVTTVSAADCPDLLGYPVAARPDILG